MLRVYSIMYLQHVWERPKDECPAINVAAADILVDNATLNTKQVGANDFADNNTDQKEAVLQTEASITSESPSVQQPLLETNDKKSNKSSSDSSVLLLLADDCSNNTYKKTISINDGSNSSINMNPGFTESMPNSIHSDSLETPGQPYDENTTCASKVTIPVPTVITEAETSTSHKTEYKTFNADADSSGQEEEKAEEKDEQDPRIIKELPLAPSRPSSHRTSTSKLSSSAQRMIHRAKSSINERAVKNIGRRTSLILEKINNHLNHHQNHPPGCDNDISPDSPLNFDESNNCGGKRDPLILPLISSAISHSATPNIASVKSLRRQSSKLANKSKALTTKLKRAISFHHIHTFDA
ncbi:hypothetical protein BDF20DRAFT_857223 [Mycotypha africana]|uniref:uncharacterized protein n=1 Tax=Mycotypha africana TaxID=64632 RepID=UPI0023018909|nr:uncharacterized protein BDF20DRAFT_857223 [Mycotypha africana]KAI8983956.1 hypothetical protein BDF20DRAFT_857223 [Mycotypha africana]